MTDSSSENPVGVLPAWTGANFVPTVRHDTYPAIDPSKANLAGKVVAITGASKGVGKGIAIAFAQAGVSGILLMARSNMKSVEEDVLAAARPGSNLKVISVSLDTSDPAQVPRAVEQAKNTFGRLDVLVNNAGLMEDPKFTTIELDPNVWWRTWEVNMRGTHNVTRAFLPLLIECGGDKTIVNLTSIAAHFVQPSANAYIMSKLALLRFTELLVAEYGSQGVLAIAIHPGSILTNMSAVLGKEWESVLQESVELAAHATVWLVWERREWLAGRYVSSLWDVDELVAKKKEIVDGDKLKVRMVV